jgi:hypothetical protein
LFACFGSAVLGVVCPLRRTLDGTIDRTAGRDQGTAGAAQRARIKAQQERPGAAVI